MATTLTDDQTYLLTGRSLQGTFCIYEREF